MSKSKLDFLLLKKLYIWFMGPRWSLMVDEGMQQFQCIVAQQVAAVYAYHPKLVVPLKL